MPSAGDPPLAARPQGHHAVGIHFDGQLHAGPDHLAGDLGVERLQPPLLVDRIGNDVRWVHRGRMDHPPVQQEVRIGLGLVVADLVAGDKHPQQRLASGDQRDGAIEALYGLVQVDAGRRQPHAARADEQRGAGQQPGRAGADPRFAVDERRETPIRSELDHGWIGHLPRGWGPRRGSRNDLSVFVEYGDRELSGITLLDAGVLGRDRQGVWI